MTSPLKLLAIVGPTASGKTERGLRLAREMNGEIISVDSRQVYKHLSVGTAKPDGKRVSGLYQVEGIPYHLVDILDPAEAFTAAEFVRRAGEAIGTARARGKRPILVGGTGMYFKALRDGLAPLPPRNDAVRAELRALADDKGRAYLHAQLARVDPEAAARIPQNNIQRVLRAMEVFRLTSKPISAWHREQRKDPSAGEPIEFYGIDLPREELHGRLERRCDWMLDNGLIEETQALLNKGYAPDCPALTGLGYPRVIAHLQRKLSRAELRRFLIQDTRQYAKRQRTWFRHQAEVLWNVL